MMGRVCLVGAGPGDPELLTVRAARLLAEAGAVLYDRLISPEILALAHPDAELIDVGKEEGQQALIQPAIYEVFVITRLNEILTILPSRDEAINSLK